MKAFGDWMIWMVHRAYLNDPTLTDLNFNNIHMPPPHIDERIAPKLVKAIGANTHIEVLSLANSNLIKAQAADLAASLAKNRTLRVVSLESNQLDSQAVKDIAQAIAGNKDSEITQLRLAPQKNMGRFFGRHVEEAIGSMMERNDRILELGFECEYADSNIVITRTLLRNNDFARGRRRKTEGFEQENEDLQADERTLGSLALVTPPTTSAEQDFMSSGGAE
jgi:hypothetical protein